MQAQAAGMISSAECGGKLSTSPECSVKSKIGSDSIRQKSRVNIEKKLSRQFYQHHKIKKANSTGVCILYTKIIFGFMNLSSYSTRRGTQPTV